jgi:hypothetical protein
MISSSGSWGAKEAAWTKKVWIYDCRTNKEFTLKERRMVRADLDEFVECCHPENRHQRRPTWNDKKNSEVGGVCSPTRRSWRGTSAASTSSG